MNIICFTLFSSATFKIFEVPKILLSQYINGLLRDSLTDFNPAKWITALIGFSSETQDVVKNAKKKLNEKKLDLIIANDVSDSSIGFDSDENEVYLITKKIEKKIEKISKKKLSRSIIEFIAKYL